MLQNSFLLSNLSHNLDKGDGGSFVATSAAWQCRWRWWQWQQCGDSNGGGSLMVTWGQTQQRSGGNSIVAAVMWGQLLGSIRVVAAYNKATKHNTYQSVYNL
jgi:hypothetical protein